MDARAKVAKELLLSSNYWVLNKDLVHELGIETAFLLTNLAEAEKMLADETGYFYQTIATLEKQSTLKRSRQDRAIKDLLKRGILEQENRGMPMKRYFRINYDIVAQILGKASMERYNNLVCRKPTTQYVENQQTSMSENNNLVCRKPTTNKESIYKDNNYKDNNIKSNREKPKLPVPGSTTEALKFKEDSVEISVAIRLIDIMLSYKPDSKVPKREAKALQSWAQDIDYMIRLDKRDPMEIIDLFKWAQADSFWIANVRSPRKLREKWDTLDLQRNRTNGPGNRKKNSNLDILAQQYNKAISEEKGGLF